MESLLKILNHKPGWDYKLSIQGVIIQAPNQQEASQIAQIYADCLLETAHKLKGRVRIAWKKCKQPIEIFGWMASEQPPTPAETAEQMLSFSDTVFTSQPRLPVPLLKRMVAAGESDREARPMPQPSSAWLPRISDSRRGFLQEPSGHQRAIAPCPSPGTVTIA